MPKKSTAPFPAMKFVKTGPKLKQADIEDYPGELTDDLQRFLLLRNGGLPSLDAFRFNFCGTKDTLARVRYFNGIQLKGKDLDFEDIGSVTLARWPILPRGAIPIGEISIDGLDFDGCTLLTFGSSRNDKSGKIYFYDNPHDCGDADPDESALTLLSHSLPAFLSSLKSYDDCFFRIVFKLNCSVNDLSLIEEALVSAGAGDFSGDSIEDAAAVERYAFWPELGTTIYLTAGKKDMCWVPLPKGATAKSCYLGLNVNDMNQASVVKKISSILKSVPAWKGSQNIGTTPAMPR